MPESIKNAACPDCGDRFVPEAVITACETLALDRRKVAWVSDAAGQAAERLRSLGCNFFPSLYGQALPAALGLKLANPNLTVVADCGGEGGRRFMSSLRRNVNLTVLTCGGQVDGLTGGPAALAAGPNLKNQPFYPLTAAIALGAGLVAQAFSGHGGQLAGLVAEAIRYPGPALVNILRPCEFFSPAHTGAWYNQRIKPVGPDHDPANLEAALLKSLGRGEEIPAGVLYRRDPAHNQPDDGGRGRKGGLSGPISLVDAPPDRLKLAGLMGASLY